jgi:predicted nucleotidyltransferase component of viral defense system
MDIRLREAQLKILEAFSKQPDSFALAGGTALELFYLNHRFSRDLDFFSPQYNLAEIEGLVSRFEKYYGKNIVLENELLAAGKARVRFYSLEVKGSSMPLKMDFVEDVHFSRPAINKIKGVPVYAVEQIYVQKILAIVCTQFTVDAIGRERITGRNEARDVVDLYFLSRKVLPLRQFLKKIQRNQQRGLVQWYRSFSRQEFKLDFLDINIYDEKLNSLEVIRYLEREIERFIQEELL